jgi:hypothetical protein
MPDRVRLSLSLTQSDYGHIQRRAERLGLPVSTFIRAAALVMLESNRKEHGGQHDDMAMFVRETSSEE